MSFRGHVSHVTTTRTARDRVWADHARLKFQFTTFVALLTLLLRNTWCVLGAYALALVDTVKETSALALRLTSIAGIFHLVGVTTCQLHQRTNGNDMLSPSYRNLWKS